MPTFKPPTIAAANFVLEFSEPVSKIRYEQARAEDAFQSVIGAQSSQTNIPDEMPQELPRIVFERGDKRILISMLRCQLDLAFKTASPLSEQLKIIESNALRFSKAAQEKFAVAPYGVTAVVLSIQTPAEATSAQLNSEIAAQFFQNRLPKEVASASIKFGIESNGHFLNFGADVYETRSFNVEQQGPGPSAPIEIKLANTKLIEAGIRYRVDVNNRPAMMGSERAADTGAQTVLAALRNFIENELNKLAGRELYA